MAKRGGAVRVSITADSSDLRREVSVAERIVSRFGKTGNTSFKVLGSAAQAASPRIGRVAAAAGAAGAAFVGISEAKAAITTTEDLAKATEGLTKNLDISVKTASEWAAVAKVRGIEAGALTQQFGILAKNEQLAKDGAQAQVDAFAKLGISQKELKNQTFNQTLGEISDGMKDLGRGTERTKVSQDIFGRGWKGIVPILRAGSTEMNRLLKSARDSGAVFSGKTLRSVHDLRKAMEQQKFAVLGLQIAFGTQLAPALTKIIPAVSKFINQVRTGKGAGGDFRHTIEDIVDAVVKMVKWFKNAWHNVDRFFQGAERAVGKVDHAISEMNRGSIRGFRNAWKAIGKVFGDVMAGIFRGFGKLFDLASHLPVVGSKFKGLGDQARKAAEKVDKVGESVRKVPSNKSVNVKARISWTESPILTGLLGKPHGGPSGGPDLNRVFQAGAQKSTDKNRAKLQGSVFGPGLGVGPLMGGGVSQFVPLAHKFGLQLTSFIRSGPAGSLHTVGRAMDFSDGYATPHELAFAKRMAGSYGNELAELIHTPLGFGIKNGGVVPLSFWGAKTNADHYDHVHVALQRGGMIPGQGVGDKVPVMAEPGEGFINKRAVQALGGAGAIEQINQMVPRFQRGGVVASDGISRKELPRFIKQVWGAVGSLLGGGGAPRVTFGGVSKVRGGKAWADTMGNHIRASHGWLQALANPHSPNHDAALETILHEFAHTRQRNDLQTWEAEGGADMWAGRHFSQVFGKLGIKVGVTHPGYPVWASRVARKKSARWINHGQFLGGFWGHGGPYGRPAPGGGIVRGAKAAKAAGFKGKALQIALAVGAAESGNYTDVVGDEAYGGSYGPWQINHPAHPQYNINRLKNDWTYAAQAAYQISGGGRNWGPWTTFRTGAYKAYMGAAARVIASLGGAPAAKAKAKRDKKKRITPAQQRALDRRSRRRSRARTGAEGLDPWFTQFASQSDFELAQAELTAGKGDDITAYGRAIGGYEGFLKTALRRHDQQTATSAAQALKSARDARDELLRGDSTEGGGNPIADAMADLAEQTKGLKDITTERHAFEKSITYITKEQAVKAFADVVSGQIGGYTSQRRATAGSGATARY